MRLRGPIVDAVESGESEKVRELLDEGADVYSKQFLSTGVSPILFLAARFGHSDVVKLLLDRGAKIELSKNREGKTPLHIASCKEHMDVVEVLLDSGADPNAKDKYGMTPLHEAIKNPTIARLLLENGANVNETINGGYTALHILCNNNNYANPDVAKVLLEHGIDINAKNESGATALHASCWGHGNPKMVKLLLENDIDILAKSKDGLTAIMMTRNKEIEELLSKHEESSSTGLSKEEGAVERASSSPATVELSTARSTSSQQVVPSSSTRSLAGETAVEHTTVSPQRQMPPSSFTGSVSTVHTRAASSPITATALSVDQAEVESAATSPPLPAQQQVLPSITTTRLTEVGVENTTTAPPAQQVSTLGSTAAAAGRRITSPRFPPSISNRLSTAARIRELAKEIGLEFEVGLKPGEKVSLLEQEIFGEDQKGKLLPRIKALEDEFQ